MPSQHELQQALTWATDKCLMLDAENSRLKTLLSQIRATVTDTMLTHEEAHEKLCMLLRPKRDA